MKIIEQQLCTAGDALMRAYRILGNKRPAFPEDMAAIEDGMDSLLAVERSLGIIPPVNPIKERQSAIIEQVFHPKT